MADLVDPTPAPAVDPTPAPAVAETFSQEQVESMIKDRVGAMKTDLESSNSNFTDALKELEAIKKINQMSTEQKTELEARLTELQDRNLTQEQISTRDLAKVNKEREERENTLNGELDAWKSKFFDSKTNQAITDAASQNEAYETQQIQAILHPITQVAEDKNEAGEGLGTYSPRVSFPDVDAKTGKPVTTELTVAEAVVRMKELKQFQNLFKGTGVGGLGDQNQVPVGKGTAIDYANLSPKAYQQAVKDGLIE